MAICEKTGRLANTAAWLFPPAVAAATTALLLHSILSDHLAATVVTRLDTTAVPLSELYFPSVVVCNHNQAF